MYVTQACMTVRTVNVRQCLMMVSFHTHVLRLLWATKTVHRYRNDFEVGGGGLSHDEHVLPTVVGTLH